MYVEVMMGKN